MKINIEQISKKIENPTVLEWFRVIAENSHTNRDNKIYKNLTKLLNKRNSIKVNLWKLNKYSKPDDYIIVPGKVLGVGALNHKINICAINFSESAKSQINQTKSQIIKLQEIINKKDVKIII